MTLMYIQGDMFNNMSNEELIKKYYQISKKYNAVQSRKVSSVIIEQVFQLYDLYEEELTKRRMDGIIDDDDIDEAYEQFEKEDLGVR